MNLDIMFSLLLLVQQNLWVVAVAIYIIGLVAMMVVADYFCGYKGGDVVAKTVGLPLTICFWIIEKMDAAVRYPWKHRNRRLLRETFGFSMSHTWEDQKKVDKKLADLASSMQYWFQNEEKLLGQTSPDWDEVESTRQMIKYAKSNFWSAHALAKKNGFETKPSFRDYLAS